VKQLHGRKTKTAPNNPADSLSNLERKPTRVALNFCKSLILRIGDFLCFAGTNFAIGKDLIFLDGN